MSTLDVLRLDAIDTPEGRAIYPWGAWRAGYLVDAATERRLRAHEGRAVWVFVAFFLLRSFVRIGLGLAFHVRVPEVASIAVASVASLVFYVALMRAILRDCPRAAYRPSTDELLRLRLSKTGRLPMVFALWSGLIAFCAIAAVTAILCDGVERWLAVMAGMAFVILFAIALRRTEMIQD